ncbi:recombinase family protein [Streptomyces rochei]|uniref:recombinase family protein n=1 Tax=Streptomyces rochei TaxID=1928 RepID=UPI002ACDA52E|nr:recombinase family protein [Streptomyces rochei]WQC12539.1 recombinase family protein [Streptomyces rochei]
MNVNGALAQLDVRRVELFRNSFINLVVFIMPTDTFDERKGMWMALVGLVRVSTDKQNVQRQHDALDPICLKVFEEKISGKLTAEERPALTAAIEYLRDGDMLCVQEVDRLGRNLLEGLIVLNDLFERGISVKVLEGIAAGEHKERSLILDLALALAEDRRRDIVKKTKDGLEAARKRGRVGGRKPVMTEALVVQAAALRDRGFTIRQIQPHLRIAEGANKGKNPSIGAISQALRAYDEAGFTVVRKEAGQ